MHNPASIQYTFFFPFSCQSKPIFLLLLPNPYPINITCKKARRGAQKIPILYSQKQTEIHQKPAKKQFSPFFNTCDTTIFQTNNLQK